MKKYIFKPYSERFPYLFSEEKNRILNVLEDVVIEHVGSTAIPGMGGKGIIDIAIGVKHGFLEKVTIPLESLGYECRRNHCGPEKLYFRGDLPDLIEGMRRYHIHVMPYKNLEWNHFIYFRDYLIAHPEEAQKYAELKKEASLTANEVGEKYRELKAPFFIRILKQ